MSIDHLAEAKAHAAKGNATESLMHGQIASVEKLNSIAFLGAAILAQLKPGAALAPIPPRRDTAEDLADILREAYELHEFGPVWPVLAKAAIEFMED